MAGDEVMGTIHGWHKNRFIGKHKAPPLSLMLHLLTAWMKSRAGEGEGGCKGKRTQYLCSQEAFLGSLQPLWVPLKSRPELQSDFLNYSNTISYCALLTVCGVLVSSVQHRHSDLSLLVPESDLRVHLESFGHPNPQIYYSPHRDRWKVEDWNFYDRVGDG